MDHTLNFQDRLKNLGQKAVLHLRTERQRSQVAARLRQACRPYGTLGHSRVAVQTASRLVRYAHRPASR